MRSLSTNVERLFFELYEDQQMSSELYAVRQEKSSRHETYCILPQCV